MQRENVGFREALEILADKAGIAVEALQGVRPSGPASDRKALFETLAWAEKQFRECLENQPASGPGRAYFDKRQISAASRATFHLGYAPNERHWLAARGKAAGIAPDLLLAAGLVRKDDSGGLYDFFRGRVMFSIRDPRQRPIAFGGRILPQFATDNTGKYLNSAESPLFHKHREVYGLDLAGPEIVKASRTAVLVEGYTDVIMAHQHGVQNVVAALGTSVTADHVQQRSVLRRYADTIVLLLDGDAAGQKKAAGLVELFVTEDADLRIASLSGGLDPCDFLLERGADALREVIDGAVDAIEHRIRTAQEGVEIDRDTFAASKALESILAALSKAPLSRPGGISAAARLREQQVLVRLAREFHVEESALRARLAELRQAASPHRGRATAPPTAAVTEPTLPAPSAFDLAGDAYEMEVPAEVLAADHAGPQVARIEAADAEFLEILTQYPSLARRALESVELEWLSPGPARAIYLMYRRFVEAGQTPELALVMSELEDVRLKSLLAELDLRATEKQQRAAGSAEERLSEVVTAFQRNRQRSDYQVASTVLHAADAESSRKTAVFLQLLPQKRSSQTPDS
jgi:DNA primase